MNKYTSLINIFHQGDAVYSDKGTILLRLGEQNTAIFFLVEGIAYSYRYNSQSEKIIHTFYGPGDILPISAINPNINLPAFFESLTNVKLHRLSIETFHHLVQHDNSAAYNLAMQVIDQYKHYVQRVGNLQYTSAYDRVIYCLLLFSSRFGQKRTNGSVELSIPLTHGLIASSVNVARETASRSIKRLTNKKLISKHGKFIIIGNVELLFKELHDNTLTIGQFT